MTTRLFMPSPVTSQRYREHKIGRLPIIQYIETTFDLIVKISYSRVFHCSEDNLILGFFIVPQHEDISTPTSAREAN